MKRGNKSACRKKSIESVASNSKTASGTQEERKNVKTEAQSSMAKRPSLAWKRLNLGEQASPICSTEYSVLFSHSQPSPLFSTPVSLPKDPNQRPNSPIHPINANTRTNHEMNTLPLELLKPLPGIPAPFNHSPPRHLRHIKHTLLLSPFPLTLSPRLVYPSQNLHGDIFISFFLIEDVF